MSAAARIAEPARLTRFDGDAVKTARRLLGQRLVRLVDGQRRAGTIVEVEAYLGRADRAAHCFGGRRTPRNESMYLEGGHAYVYFIYGMHYCMNVVCGRRDQPEAVLLRAIEPTEGIDLMFERRSAARRDRDLCSGPARLTQALDIDRRLDGIDLRSHPELAIERVRARAVPARSVLVTSRIGVGYAGVWARRPLRFCLRDNPHVSRARPS